MFTGIIEESGQVASFEKHSAGARLGIVCRAVLSDLTPGASIAVNGVCLTAVSIDDRGFQADLAPETLDRSTLGFLREGALVNLERAVTLQTRLSGHIVQGHVDATAVIESIRDLGDDNRELVIRIPRELNRYLVYKGSIAIDGISLTIAALEELILKIAVIPHTWHSTNLQSAQPGGYVNIECDVLAKHVEKLLNYAAIDATRASTSDPMFSGVKLEGLPERSASR